MTKATTGASPFTKQAQPVAARLNRRRLFVCGVIRRPSAADVAEAQAVVAERIAARESREALRLLQRAAWFCADDAEEAA